jgi:glyoxylase-like metal-dependent hydrolase (beta-lactamase superfamily II)
VRITEHVFLIGSGHFGLSHDFDSSVYVVDCGGELTVIDAGAGVSPGVLIANMRKDGLDPDQVNRLLLTHNHADHACGAHALRERFGCSVYISDKEADDLARGDETAIGLDIAKKSDLYAPDYHYTRCQADVRLNDGDEVGSCEPVLRAVEVPGHSPGSTCFQVDLPEGRALFSGDVVFLDGFILLLNCCGSSLADYSGNIGRLAGRNVDMLFPGHKMFALSEGQKHIDKAVAYLGRIEPPPNLL